MIKDNDTIAAISTATGEAAIGIVRISGNNVDRILSKIFIATKPNNIKKTKRLGFIKDPKDNALIDKVLINFFKAPNTYTGQDLAEINCHGNKIILNKLLNLAIENGARIADRGEFTKRAFINGKIDLIQAEAVIDAVKAKTELAAKSAAIRMGDKTNETNDLKAKISNILSEIEASIDFPDEIEEPKREKLATKIKQILSRMEDNINSAETGRLLNEGVKVAIIGKPNVGKSSLLNSMVKNEKAIVTDIPGTTTDLIEVAIDIKGFPFLIYDMAGIRKHRNTIEKIGIKKAMQTMESADIVLAVFDKSNKVDQNDLMIIDKIKGKRRILAVLNKSDLKSELDKDMIPNAWTRVNASALKGIGINEIERKLLGLILPEDTETNSYIYFANSRQIDTLNGAKRALSNALEALSINSALDLISIDIKEALVSLGYLRGEAINDDIIELVFKDFCVGK